MATITEEHPVTEPQQQGDAAPERRRPPRLRGGWRIVARKELADHLHSIRLIILLVLVALAGLAAVHAASGPMRDAAEEATQLPSPFLLLFTLSPERIPAFHEFVAILGPLLGIAFGFDAINAERSQRTLPRLASQPIHRDEIINGKFVAATTVIALALAALLLVVTGYGALRLGIGPTIGDVVRLGAFWLVSLAYIAFWLALAMLLSVVTRRAATAALAAIALWLVFTMFAGLIAGAIADAVRDVPENATTEQVLDNARFELNLRRLSPDQLYREATGVLLNPARQSTGILVIQEQDRALPSALDLQQSLLLAWWQVVAIVAGTILVFVAAYVVFMRQELRA
jgi:ABC-2 type transport system permease protein